MNKQRIDIMTVDSASPALIAIAKVFQTKPKPLAKIISALSKMTAISFLSSAAVAGPQMLSVPDTTNIDSVSTSGNTTTVVQNNSRAIINWQSFNVAGDEAVIFESSTAGNFTILNRIQDASPSSIDGAITAINGRVFLINPNGIIFGETATVNLGSLIATSLNITDADFLDDNKYTLESSGEGAIINRGTINASSKGVVLIGNSTANSGVIAAEIGTIVLASGTTTTLDFEGDGLIKFALNTGVNTNASGIRDAVSNSGNLSAQKVLLNATDAAGVFTNIINNDGIITASRIDTAGGVIRLLGNGPGKITLSENSDLLAERDVTVKSDGGSIDNAGSISGADYIELTTVNGGGDINLSETSELNSDSTVVIDSDGNISSRGSIFGNELVALLAKGNIQNFGTITSDSEPFILADGEIELDSDGDGVGDNSDTFPNDPDETVDSDGDGVGDNGDAFPNDPSKTEPDPAPAPPPAPPAPEPEDPVDPEEPQEPEDPVDPEEPQEPEDPVDPEEPQEPEVPEEPEEPEDVNTIINASANTGTTGTESVANNTSAVLGLYDVEGTGIRLPKDQDTELEL